VHSGAATRAEVVKSTHRAEAAKGAATEAVAHSATSTAQHRAAAEHRLKRVTPAEKLAEDGLRV
jgi:hypothetical protein